MMDYENVLLLFLSVYIPKKKEDGTEKGYKYKYDNKENGKEEIFNGRQTNEAPVNCLVSLAEADAKIHNRKKAFDKILCIGTKEVFENKAWEGKTTYQLFEERLKAYCKKQNINSDFEICRIEYNMKDEEKNDPTTERRAMYIYGQISDALNIKSPEKKKTYVYVDYTGGFRDISFLMTSIIRYLEFADIECKKIVYSNLSKSDESKNRIYELNCIYDMYQMINGVSEFVSTGNAVQLGKLFEKENTPDLINAIIEFSNSMAVCDMSKIDKTVSDMAKLTEEVQEEHNSVYYEMFKSMIPMIREKMRLDELVTQEKKGEINYPVLIDWCTDNGLIQQATTLYVEKMPFYYIEKGLLKDYVCVEKVVPTQSATKESTAFYTELYAVFKDKTEEIIMAEDSYEREEEDFLSYIREIWDEIKKSGTDADKLQKLHEKINMSDKFEAAGKRLLDILKDGYDLTGKSKNGRKYEEIGVKQKNVTAFMNTVTGQGKGIRYYCLTGDKDVEKHAENEKQDKSSSVEKGIRNKVKALKNLEDKELSSEEDYNKLYHPMLYYFALKMLRNRMNHDSNRMTDADRDAVEYLASKGIHFMKEGTDINAEDAQFELDIDTIKEIIREGIAPELKENKKIK